MKTKMYRLRTHRAVLFCGVLVFFLSLVFSKTLTAVDEPSKTEIIQKTKSLQIPFVANDGQTDERVRFYANTFSGTVFVTKDGEIVYALPEVKSEDAPEEPGKEARDGKAEARGQKLEARSQKPEDGIKTPVSQIRNLQPKIQNLKSDIPNLKSAIQNPKSQIQGVVLKEEIVGGKISGVKGEGSSATKVNYFKGNDPSKWKTNIATYDAVSLGEVYDGIELKLKTYGNNVENLFCVKPGADPTRIKIKLSGVEECGVRK